MDHQEPARRDFLRGAAALGVGALAGSGQAAGAEPRSGARAVGVSVRRFGARGDGKHDDTDAFQSAFHAVASQGGGRVYVPAGRYRIATHLDVPPNVVLQGDAVGPTIHAQTAGSTLLAVEGRGDLQGTPFITLHENSALDGITVFYPDQTQPEPDPYPWCVRGTGDNVTVRNTLLVNPYQAVDFGTHPAGRHFIDGLYGQPLLTGLLIDQCFDVGRVANIHFWPFWSSSPQMMRWTSTHATAFILGRTDWEYMFNCFCIAYQVGYHVRPFKNGPGNLVLTQCGSDEGADGTTVTSVRVDDCQGHAGISFVNGQFMGTTAVDVADTNTGPVKFTACGFWGMPNQASVATLAGRGNVSFEGCHFTGWAQSDPGAPAIDAACQGLTVTGCDFMNAGKPQVRLRKGCRSAIIAANRLRGGAKVENEAGIEAQIGLNSVE